MEEFDRLVGATITKPMEVQVMPMEVQVTPREELIVVVMARQFGRELDS